MDKLKKYEKIRRRLESASGILALIIGSGISSRLGIYGNKFMSVDTALSIAIVVLIAFVLNYISNKIVDIWYEKNMDK